MLKPKLVATEKLFIIPRKDNPNRIEFKVRYSGGAFDENNKFHILLNNFYLCAWDLITAPPGTAQLLQTPDPETAHSSAIFEIEVYENDIMKSVTGRSGKRSAKGPQSLAVQLADYLATVFTGIAELDTTW